MEHDSHESKPRPSGSFGGGSSGRHSVNFSRRLSFQSDYEKESEIVSEAGDIGDRALCSSLRSDGSNVRLSFDNSVENGDFFASLSSNLSHANRVRANASTAALHPLSTEAMVDSKENVQEEREKALTLPPFVDYVTCLVYLAVFGILGVLTRYLLRKLFGPGIAGVTSDHSPLYSDLPSNMVGSFLMGWWGVVFKGDISYVCTHLAIGLTTGYLGSLTTFSGWNQKMLDLSVNGQWVFSVVGILIGLFLAAYSIKFGVETAKCFKLLLEKLNRSGNCNTWRVDSWKRHLLVMVVLLLILALLLTVSGTQLKQDYNTNASGAQLWAACIVAAPGVWIRWFLARLNGRGLGKSGHFKWLPFGTLAANVSAASIMAAISTLRKAVHTKSWNIISSGIQFGFLGCLSTVSTFMAEYYAMEESTRSWRAYAYALTTIILSFVLGTLIYSVPVWIKGYK
ncbi:hypothetical protein K2173_026096 [Erythroxylum novogranatense]|uniref:Camphor resistance CrcB family protein n=1 Tax=Erythroxylum novogranatense TaxID=1862640 RepID=A0AAV8TWD8_9ROSI|nr:hypothetical protein K2173_026096 [Erythroxylum novogranatense]